MSFFFSCGALIISLLSYKSIGDNLKKTFTEKWLSDVRNSAADLIFFAEEINGIPEAEIKDATNLLSNFFKNVFILKLLLKEKGLDEDLKYHIGLVISTAIDRKDLKKVENKYEAVSRASCESDNLRYPTAQNVFFEKILEIASSQRKTIDSNITSYSSICKRFTSVFSPFVHTGANKKSNLVI